MRRRRRGNPGSLRRPAASGGRALSPPPLPPPGRRKVVISVHVKVHLSGIHGDPGHPPGSLSPKICATQQPMRGSHRQERVLETPAAGKAMQCKCARTCSHARGCARSRTALAGQHLCASLCFVSGARSPGPGLETPSPKIPVDQLVLAVVPVLVLSRSSAAAPRVRTTWGPNNEGTSSALRRFLLACLHFYGRRCFFNGFAVLVCASTLGMLVLYAEPFPGAAPGHTCPFRGHLLLPGIFWSVFTSRRSRRHALHLEGSTRQADLGRKQRHSTQLGGWRCAACKQLPIALLGFPLLPPKSSPCRRNDRGAAPSSRACGGTM